MIASASVSGALFPDVDVSVSVFGVDVSVVARRDDGGPTSEFNETSAGDSFFVDAGDDSRVISDAPAAISVFGAVVSSSCGGSFMAGAVTDGSAVGR